MPCHDLNVQIELKQDDNFHYSYTLCVNFKKNTIEVDTRYLKCKGVIKQITNKTKRYSCKF